MTTKSKAMILNVSDALFTKDGMAEFYWPVAQEDLHALRDNLLRVMWDIVDDLNADKDIDDKYGAGLSIIYIEIVREILVIVRTEKFYNEANAAQRDLTSNKNFPYLQALENDQSYDPILKKRFSYLEKKVPSPENWKKPLRPLKFLIDNLRNKTPYKRKSLQKIGSQDIAVLSNAPFVIRHMSKATKENGTSFILYALWEWFDIDPREIPTWEQATQSDYPFVESLQNELSAVFVKHGFPLSPHAQSALKTITTALLFYADYYRSHLLNPKRRAVLPKNLWFGSTNSFFVRLLREAVKVTGGHTTGHDHGRAFGTGLNYGELGTIFDFCDEFVTYSDFLAIELETFQQTILEKSTNKTPIKFTGFKDLFMTPEDVAAYKEKLKPPQKSDPKKPSVMIMMPILIGEHIAGLNTLPADHVFCDFYARLISFFKKQGFQVLMKLHPESRITPNHSLFDTPDVHVLTGYIEDHLHDVDLIAFDFLSSAFKTQVMADKPLMFFDFGHTVMSEQGRHYFLKRTATVPCVFNAKNQSTFEESDAIQAIADARDRATDQSFIKVVYGLRENV